MHVPKASPELGEKAEASPGDHLLEVIVELQPSAPTRSAARQSRAEKIAAQKSAFAEAARPLTDLIASKGGQVTGEVWLNNTLRAMVPAKLLPELGADALVSALDVANKLERG